MAKITSLFIIVCCFIFDVYGHRADFITPCSWDDEKCLLSSAQHAVPAFAEGLKEFDIDSSDPLHIKVIKVNEDGLELILKAIKVTGLSQCKIKSISRDIKASTISLTLHCPIKAVCEYTVDGKLKFIPITGAGPCKIETDELKLSAVIHIQTEDGSDGKKYWKIKNVDHTFEPVKKVYITLDNLYNGDKNKAKPVEEILDKKWEELINIFGKPMVKQVVELMTQNIVKITKHLSADQLEIVL